MTHVTHALVETPDQLKARGAFYTPAELTEFLARWAVRLPDDRVLEPSCGDGAFISAVTSRYADLGVAHLDSRFLGVEREAQEAVKARALAPGAEIQTLDFFDLDPEAVVSVDAAIGNPPYIRYHGFTGDDRARALARTHAQGVELTRLASSWAHFVIHSAAFLKPDGRLALVLPAELLHADYSRPVRRFLLDRFSSVVVVAFDRMVFPDAQVDAVLLLASHDDDRGLRVIRVTDERSLPELDVTVVSESDGEPNPIRWSASVDAAAGAIYYDALMQYAPVQLGEIAQVDIGFVSGANSFFVLSDEEADRWRLPRQVLTAAVRRPSDVRGLEVRQDELRWLLDLTGKERVGPEVAAYLAHGESIGVADGYKCRVRKPWYAVPLPKRRPDAFLPYMSHLGPRLIANGRRARNTNLLHGVALSETAPPVRTLAVAMTSSLTLLSAEIEGRAYGGGVLKLETREAEKLLVPRITPASSKRLAEVFADTDAHVRGGDVRSAARIADATLGLDHERLWDAYLSYRDRRLGRRRVRAQGNGHDRP